MNISENGAHFFENVSYISENGTDTSDSVLFLEKQISKAVHTYFSPCILLVGTVASILSIVVLSRKTLRRTPTMFYLLILSIADLLVLYTGLLRYWLSESFGFKVRRLDDWVCKLHTFLVYFSLDFASWILVAVTVDRCVSVMIPLKAKLCCTLKASRCVVVVIMLVLALINGHFIFTIELKRMNTQEVECRPSTETADFLNQIWPWIDFAVFCFFPIGIMAIANVLIIRKITTLHPSITTNASRRESCAHPNTESESVGTISSGSLGWGNKKKRHEQRGSFDDCIVKHVSNKKTNVRTSTNLTTMLLCVNLVFILCTAPIGIYFIGRRYWTNEVLSSREQAKMSLAYSIVNNLQYVNNSVHFFLYCITGKRFRGEFYKLFKRK